MRTSVIIPTYQGAHKLPVVLDAVRRQKTSVGEVVVVVDGSTDETLAWLEAFAPPDISLHVITQPNRGRAAARNRGARNASGDLLIFYDDDMQPAPDSVSRHVHFHQSHGSSLLSGNQVEERRSLKTEVQNYKAWLNVQWLEKYADGVQALSVSNLFFTAANCSMPKIVWEQLGGFDERLTDAEDFDLAVRALRKNIPVFFDKDNASIHHDPITFQGYCRRMDQYGVARKKLNALYPGEKSFIPQHPGLAKRAAYSFFSIPLFSWMVDNFNVFRLLPTRMRYYLYGVMLQSQFLRGWRRPV